MASGWKLAALGQALEFVGPVRFGSTLGALGSKPGALVVFDSRLGVLAGAVAFGWKLAALGSTLVALGRRFEEPVFLVYLACLEVLGFLVVLEYLEFPEVAEWQEEL